MHGRRSEANPEGSIGCQQSVVGDVGDWLDWFPDDTSGIRCRETPNKQYCADDFCTAIRKATPTLTLLLRFGLEVKAARRACTPRNHGHQNGAIDAVLLAANSWYNWRKRLLLAFHACPWRQNAPTRTQGTWCAYQVAGSVNVWILCRKRVSKYQEQSVELADSGVCDVSSSREQCRICSISAWKPPNIHLGTSPISERSGTYRTSRNLEFGQTE
jgi:hypothetical protein